MVVLVNRSLVFLLFSAFWLVLVTFPSYFSSDRCGKWPCMVKFISQLFMAFGLILVVIRGRAQFLVPHATLNICRIYLIINPARRIYKNVVVIFATIWYVLCDIHSVSSTKTLEKNIFRKFCFYTNTGKDLF
jgi:hypothetical protein